MEAQVYNQSGKAMSKVELPADLFNLPWNADLVHQVVTAMRANQRANTAQAKGRGEVRGGGKKPWRQKGTGRARHGSIRSPLWKGGGVTHGPSTERNYTQKINSKMKAKALLTVLSQKARDGEVLLVDNVEIKKPQTGLAQKMLKQLGALKGYEQLTYKTGRRALVLVPQANPNLIRSFRNLPAVELSEIRNLNPLAAITYKYLILTEPETSFSVLTQRRHV